MTSRTQRSSPHRELVAFLAMSIHAGCGDPYLDVLSTASSAGAPGASGASGAPAVAGAAGAAGSVGAAGAAGAVCTGVADCDDGRACTFDACGATGRCSHDESGCDWDLGTEELSVTVEYQTDSYTLTTDNTYTPLMSDESGFYFVWIDGDRRPQVTQSGPDQPVSARLDPGDDYQVRDDGVHKFSLGIDAEGYLHLAGDMHHHPASNQDHLPDRYLTSRVLYWVSDAPRSVASFTFQGSDPQRAIPGYGFSYGSFHVAPDGTLYYLTRIRVHEAGHATGEIGLALYRYATATRQWTALGALPPSDPPAQYPCVLWEDNGEDGTFFQGLRASLRFDRRGRMHLAATLNNDDAVAAPTHVVYAASDDGGESFQRADGSPITELPLRVDAGASQVDVVAGPHTDLDLFASVFHDGNYVPAVVYSRNAGELGGYFRHFLPASGGWSEELASPVGGLIREKHHVDRAGIVTFVEQSGRVLRTRDFESPGVEHTVTVDGQGIWLHSIDELALRRDDVWRAVYELRDSPGMGVVRLIWSQP